MKPRPSRRDLITGAAALAAYSQIGDVRAQTARKLLLAEKATATVIPPPAATYLPTVGSSPIAVFGVRKMVSSYSGPLLQVLRASDNATMDVAQLGNGLPNLAAVVSWAAGSATTVSKWYDQVNSNHATNAVVASQPIFDASGQYGVYNAFNSFKAIVMDGWVDISNNNNPKYLMIPTSLSFNRNNYTIVYAFEPTYGCYNELYSELINGASAYVQHSTAQSTSGIGATGGTTVYSGRRPRQMYQTLGMTGSASNYTFFQDGQIIAAAAKSSVAILGATLGYSVTPSPTFFAKDNHLALIYYPAALSSADMASVQAAINATFGLPTSTGTGSQVVAVGDSILASASPSASTQNRSTIRGTRPYLKSSVSGLYNFGIPSQTLALLIANSATREFLLATDGTYTTRVLVIQIASADLDNNGGTAGYGATLYSSMSSYITNARAAGYTKIVLNTLLPRSNNANWNVQTTQYWTEMNSYNSLVRANSAGADAICDLANAPLMGVYANTFNTTYYQDNLHPTGYGYTLLAPLYVAAINSVLP